MAYGSGGASLSGGRGPGPGVKGPGGKGAGVRPPGLYPWITYAGGRNVGPYRGTGPWFPGGGSTPPAQPGGAPGQAPGQTSGQNPSGGSPLDATYYLNTGQNQFATNNRVNALNQQGAYDTTNLQAALGKLSYAQPRQELALEQRANNRGGLYSSVYNQQLGDMNNSYQGQQSGLQDTYARNMAHIQSQIAGAQGGERLYETGQAYASTQRAAAAAARNPALGQAPGATPGGSPGAAPVTGSVKGVKGGKGGSGRPPAYRPPPGGGRGGLGHGGHGRQRPGGY